MTAAVAGAAAVALLELDAASVGVTLLSRPFVAGPLLGWALGDAAAGAFQGLVFEALTIRELPLGGRLDFSATAAAGAAAWLAAGPAALPGEAAFLAGLAAGWAHALVLRSLRRSEDPAAGAEAALAAGRPPRLGARLAAALGRQAAATFAVVLPVLAAGAPLAEAWSSAPEPVRRGALAAFLSAPWVGGGGLAASLWRQA